MRLSTNQESKLFGAGFEGFGEGEKLAGFYEGEESITTAQGDRTVYVFKSLGEDGCCVEKGMKFKVFESGLLKWQMETGIPGLVAKNGLTMPKNPYLILKNYGKQKIKDKKTGKPVPGKTSWKIEVEIDFDKKAEDYFGMREAFDNNESKEPKEKAEEKVDTFEVNYEGGDDFL